MKRPGAGRDGALPRAFEGWPEHLADLKILDPCCGSGHFLVAALSMLVPMRVEQEGLPVRDAVDAVLRENLHGLEIDPRCVELAAFALALAAWTYPGAGGYRPLPEMHLACSGLAPNATKEQWIELAQQAAEAGGMPADRNLFGVDDNLLSTQVRNSLEELHDLFGKAPERGSLIDPRELKGDLFQHDYESVRSLFAAVLEQELTTDEQAERAVAAQGMARAAELMAGNYHLVITNVPYLARGKQGEDPARLLPGEIPRRKERLGHRVPAALPGAVRRGRNRQPRAAAELAVPQELQETPGETAEDGDLALARPPGAGCVRNHQRRGRQGDPAHFEPRQSRQQDRRFSRKNGTRHDVRPGRLEFRTAGEKAARLVKAKIEGVEQVRQLKNPDARVALEEIQSPPIPKQILLIATKV